MLKTNTYLTLAAAVLLTLAGCKQSDPPEIGREGDIVEFSGYTWTVKTSDTPVGPGPNLFSERFSDVYVDGNGWLHMRISQYNNQWWASEVVGTDVVGYGRYEWTVGSDVQNLPSNLVVGLFTWDNNTFQEAANSEVDIEFSRWGNDNAASPLTYSVQPVSFGDFFAERTHHSTANPSPLTGVSTHVFNWTDSLVTWESYEGDVAAGEPFATWSFDLNNPARQKVEGGNTSDPIIIPTPGATTNARINFWILPHLNPAPQDEEEHELIVRRFRYTPF